MAIARFVTISHQISSRLLLAKCARQSTRSFSVKTYLVVLVILGCPGVQILRVVLVVLVVQKARAHLVVHWVLVVPRVLVVPGLLLVQMALVLPYKSGQFSAIANTASLFVRQLNESPLMDLTM